MDNPYESPKEVSLSTQVRPLRRPSQRQKFFPWLAIAGGSFFLTLSGSFGWNLLGLILHPPRYGLPNWGGLAAVVLVTFVIGGLLIVLGLYFMRRK